MGEGVNQCAIRGKCELLNLHFAFCILQFLSSVKRPMSNNPNENAMKYLIIALCSLIVPAGYAGTTVDTFDDGNFDGWHKTQLGDPTTEWRVVDGELVSISDFICNFDIASGLMIGEPTWTDYTVTVEFKFERFFVVQCGRVNLGVATRSRDGRVLNEVSFGVNSKDGDVWRTICGRNVNGQWTLFHEGIDTVKIQPQQWYTIRIVALGATHQMFIDGQPICDFEAVLPVWGGVVLWGGNGEVRFDNFTITGPQVPDRDLSPLSVAPKGKLATVWGQMKRRRNER